MATYRISGIWKDSDGVITHYAFHTAYVRDNNHIHSKMTKTSKAEAIRMLETRGNSATTMVWDYGQAIWYIGEEVTVVTRGTTKYLKSKPDHELTDNLGHLIDWDS